MDKYPRGYVVYNSRIVDDNDKAADFIKKILNDELPLIDAKSIFEMNTPEYSANLIKELF